MSGVGIDLLEVDRLEQALERTPRLAERLFTDAEREYASTHARPVMHLAARFCAKEAVAKALELESWNPHEIEMAGREVRLHGGVLAAAAGRRVEVSLTHSRGMAGAVAVTR